MQSQPLHQAGMLSSELPELSSSRYLSSAAYQQMQGLSSNHPAQLRSGNQAFNNNGGMAVHLSSQAAGWTTRHSAQQMPGQHVGQLGRSIDPRVAPAQQHCMLSSQEHGECAMLLDTPQQRHAARQAAQITSDTQQAQWQAYSSSAAVSTARMPAGAAALSSQRGQYCQQRGQGRPQFSSAQDDQSQALMMRRLREQLAKGTAQQGPVTRIANGLSSTAVEGCRRTMQARQWSQQGQQGIDAETSEEYLNDMQDLEYADVEVDVDDEFNSSMTNESGATDSEEDLPVISHPSPCPPLSYNEGAPQYIAGTTKPKNGWFQPCRGCGSFTSRSLPVSERVVPLCTRCQSTWAQMAEGVYPPHTAERLRSVEPLTLWLPSHVSLNAGVILDRQERSTMCLNILLQIDDQWQAYVDS